MATGLSRSRLMLVVWAVAVGIIGRAAERPVYPADDAKPVASAALPEREAPRNQTPGSKAAADPTKVDDLLKLDIEQLSKVPVPAESKQTNLTAPSSQLNVAASDAGEVTTTAELLKQLPSVSARRVSALTLDPRVRGYHSSQLNGTANGMNQLKSRVDIDSIFSQIDPGIMQNVTVIDGPYTSLYGPGFAFLVADLLSPPRYPNGPETHFSTNFVYGSNAQTLYSRDNVISGGANWGACVSYGLRTGNDYFAGGDPFFAVPSRYQKWDGMASVGYDIDAVSRIEFDFLRTEINDMELPGVVYDVQSSQNEQYNLKYVIQEHRDGPKQVVLQSWYNRTAYHGDASRPSKQESLYRAFFTDPALDEPIGYPVNTVGIGALDSLGVRFLRTFGDADAPQLTVGVDWRRYRQWYDERNLNSSGELVFYGNVFGIPRSQMDDVGALVDWTLPLTDKLSVTVGGRVDQCTPSMDPTDPIVTQFSDPTEWYYLPGFDQQSNTLGMAYITGKQKLSEVYTLKAGAAFAMRNPNLTELYNDEPYVPFARFGNTYIDGLSNLRPEKNLQLDLGLSCEYKKVTCGVRAFYSIIRDYIMPVPAYIDPSAPASIVAPKVLGRNFRYFPYRTDLLVNTNADTSEAGYQYVNINEAVLLGGDLSADVRVRDGLTLFGTMSYVYGVNNSPVQFVASDTSTYAADGQIVPLGGSDGLPGIYPLNGTVGVRLFEPTEDRWCIEFMARMVRTQDHVAVTLSEIANPGFTTFALHGHYRLRKNVRVSLDIDNLFNRYYSEPDSLAIIGPSGLPVFVPEPGFSALLGLDAKF
jgi:iron complex outermembrane recepter protein